MRSVWERGLRSSAYLLLALASGMVTLVALPMTLVVVLTVSIGGLGFVLLPRWMGLMGRWAAWHRAGAARLVGLPVPRVPEPEAPDFRSLWRRPSTRRVLLWMPLSALAGIVLGLLGFLGVGLVLSAPQFLFWWAYPEGDLQLLWLPMEDWGTALTGFATYLGAGTALFLWGAPPAARAYARMNLLLLAPTEAELLAERVDELKRTRAEVVDAHGAELRRIERDLHDGTQARLVAIAMRLGVAREAVDADPAVAALLRDAHEGTEEAMAELREVIRGIYPPILADRGLAGALAALTARTTPPTRLDVGELGALPVAVETAAYFVVAESVTNAARHSGAERIGVLLERVGDVLRVRVEDDGSGGVDEERGSGVRGLRRRVAALDGTVRVDSPAGGPTVILVELPCAS
ncbi:MULTISPECIES: histidine kinase [unclassified Nocardiopsis]|uniref:sensor histidine kinase n=1 Tax=unclassified Nocardiopsis TaxID=2649073 RepID=UPI00135B2C8C|nr:MULTISPECIES: histidine kinase [unclassified Nocardiopsis]